MFIQTQYCVDGVGDVKTKWAVYVAPNHLWKNFFMWVSCFVCFILKQSVHFRTAFFQGVIIVTLCFKTTICICKKFMIFIINVFFVFSIDVKEKIIFFKIKIVRRLQ